MIYFNYEYNKQNLLNVKFHAKLNSSIRLFDALYFTKIKVIYVSHSDEYKNVLFI